MTDSMGAPWTAAYVDTIGQPAADLRSDIAAEARAKITYERLIKVCDDAGLKDTLNFLMSREVAHQKMFEAALDAIAENFPPGTLAGEEELNHAYFQDAADYGSEGTTETAEGFDLVQQHSPWGFELDQNPAAHAAEEPVQ